MSRIEYIGFELTTKFKNEIVAFIKENGYTSISEFIRESIRIRMENKNRKLDLQLNGGKSSKEE